MDSVFFIYFFILLLMEGFCWTKLLQTAVHPPWARTEEPEQQMIISPLYNCRCVSVCSSACKHSHQDYNPTFQTDSQLPGCSYCYCNARTHAWFSRIISGATAWGNELVRMERGCEWSVSLAESLLMQPTCRKNSHSCKRWFSTSDFWCNSVKYCTAWKQFSVFMAFKHMWILFDIAN